MVGRSSIVRVNACSTTIDCWLPVLNTIACRPSGNPSSWSGENVSTWWAGTAIGSIVTKSSVRRDAERHDVHLDVVLRRVEEAVRSTTPRALRPDGEPPLVTSAGEASATP